MLNAFICFSIWSQESIFDLLFTALSGKRLTRRFRRTSHYFVKSVLVFALQGILSGRNRICICAFVDTIPIIINQPFSLFTDVWIIGNSVVQRDPIFIFVLLIHLLNF